MPRIPTTTILQAYQQSPLLPLLLQECRTLESARNELRWLREHAFSFSKSRLNGRNAPANSVSSKRTNLLRTMCKKRARGMPLQYILGNQPFGDLEILCRPGVLIPRPETELFTFRTAKLILEIAAQHSLDVQSKSLRILDLCTGTGCISLLLHALLSPYFPRLSILGIDLSIEAIELAERNISHNVRRGLLSTRSISDVQFRQGDVLNQQKVNSVTSVEEILYENFSPPEGFECDLLVSNPPYISPTAFQDGTTARSVRTFEPKVALVPPTLVHSAATEVCLQEDLFYYYIFPLALKLCAKLTVLECGDYLQAERVATLCKSTARAMQADNLVIDVWNADNDLPGNIDGSTMNGPHAVVVQQL